MKRIIFMLVFQWTVISLGFPERARLISFGCDEWVSSASDGKSARLASEFRGRMLKADSLFELAGILQTPPVILPNSAEAVSLVQSLRRDLFYNVSPFASAPAAQSTAEIALRAVVNFERKMFRTIENILCWNSGYDFVQYKVFHFDGSLSHILGFRKSTNKKDCGLGMPDRRPLTNIFAISNGLNEPHDFRVVVNGVSVEWPGTEADRMAQVEGIVPGSVSRKGLFEVTQETVKIYDY